MPFKSKAQMRKLFKINPVLAEKMARETKDISALPARLGRKPKKR